jgi:hypothetical protein
MPAHCFFVLYYEDSAADRVDNVCEQLTEAMMGERAIVTAPDGMMIEQFVVEKAAPWEDDS